MGMADGVTQGRPLWVTGLAQSHSLQIYAISIRDVKLRLFHPPCLSPVSVRSGAVQLL